MVLKYNRQSHIFGLSLLIWWQSSFSAGSELGVPIIYVPMHINQRRVVRCFTISVNGVCVVDIGCAEFMWVEFPKRRDLIQEDGYFC